MNESIRQEYVQLALESYPSMISIISHMTEEELHAALQLESESMRRQSIMNRLIGRLVRINARNHKQQLKEQYNAP